MINKILAYTILNMKSLLKDKIPFIWAILLPMVKKYSPDYFYLILKSYFGNSILKKIIISHKRKVAV